MPLKVNSSIHHSEAEKVQVTPKGTQRTLLHYLSSILYLHIQKNFYPSESLRLEGFFDKTTEEKLKAGCTPAVVTISQTCYKITFFNRKIIAGFFFSDSYTQTFYILSADSGWKRIDLQKQKNAFIQLVPIQDNVTTLLCQDYAYNYMIHQTIVDFLIYLYIKQNIQSLNTIIDITQNPLRTLISQNLS